MKTKIITISIMITLLGLPVASGHTVILNFERLGALGDGGYLGSSSYSENGFTLTTSTEFGFKRITITDSIALFGRYPDDIKTLTKNDGGPFDLLSIDYYPYFPSHSPIEFTGTLYDGNTIYQTFPAYEGNEYTVIFDDFSDLVSVSWQGGGGIYVHFDNITISPEPTTILLFSLGSLVLIRMRKAD